jgi:hypothetical protein
MYVQTRSPNHSCHGKAISITYSECVSATLVIQHAMHVRHIMLSSVACLHLPNVSTLSHKWSDSGEKVIEHTMCICTFSTTFVCNISHSKKNWARYCHKCSLWIKPTDALSSNFIGITTLLVYGSLSAHHQEFLAVHRHPVTNRHKLYQCQCMAKNSWWWAERLPETSRVVIPIKLELSASVGFIHKESITTHGHTVLKYHKCTYVFM